MSTLACIVLIWVALQLPFALLIGKSIHWGME
jgi:hypothetical protein